MQDIDELTLAALTFLQSLWDTHRRGEDNPFSNTGAQYNGTACSIHAYSWSDPDQPFNFKWRDISVTWYKYLGRGTEISRKVTPEEVEQLLAECGAELRKETHTSFVPTLRAITESQNHV